jgi:hypothetical protein
MAAMITDSGRDPRRPLGHAEHAIRQRTHRAHKIVICHDQQRRRSIGASDTRFSHSRTAKRCSRPPISTARRDNEYGAVGVQAGQDVLNVVVACLVMSVRAASSFRTVTIPALSSRATGVARTDGGRFDRQ